MPAGTRRRMGFRQRVEFLLNYEPSWFPEFSAGLALTGWGLGAWFTDDFIIGRGGYALALFCMMFGMFRWFLLLRLWWGPRALAATVSACIWSWVFVGAAMQFGPVPSLGQTAGILSADLLALARFSLPCLRDLINEYRGRRGPK